MKLSKPTEWSTVSGGRRLVITEVEFHDTPRTATVTHANGATSTIVSPPNVASLEALVAADQRHPYGARAEFDPPISWSDGEIGYLVKELIDRGDSVTLVTATDYRFVMAGVHVDSLREIIRSPAQFQQYAVKDTAHDYIKDALF